MEAAAPVAATAVTMKMHTEAGFNFQLDPAYGGGQGSSVTYPPLVSAPPAAQYQLAINWVAGNVTPGNLIEIKVLESSTSNNANFIMTLAVVYWG